MKFNSEEEEREAVLRGATIFAWMIVLFLAAVGCLTASLYVCCEGS